MKTQVEKLAFKANPVSALTCPGVCHPSDAVPPWAGSSDTSSPWSGAAWVRVDLCLFQRRALSTCLQWHCAKLLYITGWGGQD